MVITCLMTTATLGLQPTWFTSSHLFWVHKLLYFVFVDIFHSLAIPFLMARTIPWQCPKSETREFYVRPPEVLEPRRPISIHSKMTKSEASWMKTTSIVMEPPTLVLPENPAPWILQDSQEQETLEKIPRLQKGCSSFPFSVCTTSKLMLPSGKKSLENQKHFNGPQQKLDLLNLEWSPSNQGQRWKPEIVFAKQAFRCGPPRGGTRIAAEEEMEIRKYTNEFGQNVLRYSRNHSTPVRR